MRTIPTTNSSSTVTGGYLPFSTGKQKTIHARFFLPYAQVLYFFDKTKGTLVRGRNDTTENKKQFTLKFSCPTHHCFPKFLFFLRMLHLHPLSLQTIRRLILKFCLGFKILILFRISRLGFRIFNHQEVVFSIQRVHE